MAQRLLIVAPSAYPLGGVAVWLDYLVPGLAARGWEVTVGLVQGRFHDVERYVRCYPGLDSVRPIDNRTGSPQGRINALLRSFRSWSPDLILAVNIPDVYRAVNACDAPKLLVPAWPWPFMVFSRIC